MGTALHAKMRRIAEVSAHDVDELRVSPCGPDHRHVPDRPQQEADDPEAKPQSNGSRSVPLVIATARGRRQARSAPSRHDGRALRTRNRIVCDRFAHRPPLRRRTRRTRGRRASCKRDRRRTRSGQGGESADVSPKGGVGPVSMMMITAMIVAMGLRSTAESVAAGCSQGMFKPSA